MSKKLICVHGWMGNPQRNWLPWLKVEAQKLGLNVEIPQFPDTEEPHLPEWIKILQKTIGEDPQKTILVGHSLGCDAILRYAETLKTNQTIAGAILVAPYFDETDFEDLKDFAGKPVDIEKVKQIIKHKVAIFSDNDPHVPLTGGIKYQQRLDSKIVILKKHGHFTQEDGYRELPQVLTALKEMVSKPS